MTESEDHCPQCESEHFRRVPQMPFIKRSVESRDSKVGEETKAAIEANREVLKDMKKQASREYYRDDN
jgi:predicted  nucleic acid-binding Zn-ribbon protein